MTKTRKNTKVNMKFAKHYLSWANLPLIGEQILLKRQANKK